MQHSPSWGANHFYTIKGIPKISRKSTVNHRTLNRPPTIPIMSRINPFHKPITRPERPFYYYLTIHARLSPVIFFPQDIPNKRNKYFINLSCKNKLLSGCILRLAIIFSCPSLSQSHSIFQYTDPITHTAYIYSKMQWFQYFLIPWIILYVSLVYWLPRNLPINWSWFHIQLYTSMYVWFELTSISSNFPPNLSTPTVLCIKNFR
jgi:hypothetical protein